MRGPLRYRLGLDIGSTSIGWCMLRLSHEEPPQPIALIKMGVRIFPDGRNPKDGSSLAVTRRKARAMRRRRDRLLKRKNRLMEALIRLDFFPQDKNARAALIELDPYGLRRKGLDEALTPPEFARALFHINQRRGFKSNRKTDKSASDTGALKGAIKKVRERLAAEGARTVGEWLAKRHDNCESVRARLRGSGTKAVYDFYIDRAMIEAEFDALWAKQAQLQPGTFTEEKRAELKDILLFQRPLRPVKPGRCTLMPDEERAPQALPSMQRFRIVQEVNNLRLLTDELGERILTLEQRNVIINLLEKSKEVTFTAIKKALKLGGTAKFNLEDAKRDKLKGNATSVLLAKKEFLGEAWNGLNLQQQDDLAYKLVTEQSEAEVIAYLESEFGIDEERAERIANATLPDGYGSLCRKALERVLPELLRAVVTFDKAVIAAGFEHHSAISHSQQTGEIMYALPYYGEALQRHVGFAKENPRNDEERFGKIANPTVHIGLNELRKVVNRLIERYGLPSEIIVEVARELKQSKARRDDIRKNQAERQTQNDDFRAKIKTLIHAEPTGQDIQKMRLWMELNPGDAANRRCPYTGEQISMEMLFSDAVEVEHILPFSTTLDDSLNNKTVALRRANRDKGNKTPFDAFGHSPEGYDFAAILERAKLMPKEKAKRFAEDGYQRWLREDDGFLARALNDTAYLSRIAKEYLSLVCPHNKVRVIPGRMTAMLRGKFGLNALLSGSEQKNRDDHRHHAIDAAVIAVTDQGLLQRFAQASADARDAQLNRLVKTMPMPWPTYRHQVAAAVERIIVSFKPDHGYQGEIFDSTVYGLRGKGKVTYRQEVDEKFVRPVLNREVVEFRDMAPQNAVGEPRHGVSGDGQPQPYMGLWSRSNYCIEIVRNEAGEWDAEVIPRYRAYQIVNNDLKNEIRLRDPVHGLTERPLVFRLMIDDTIRMNLQGKLRLLRVTKISSSGGFTCTELNEANVSNRYGSKLAAVKAKKMDKPYDERALDDEFILTQLSTGSLKAGQARQVTISPIGELRDPGFKA